jgi:hypothetical protein
MEMVVQKVLDEADRLVVHLLAQVVHQLDAVVREGIVACGDHDAAVKAVHPRDVGHRGGGGDVQEEGLPAGCGDAAHQRVLQHVARAPGVLADDDPGGLLAALALFALRVVPAEEPADQKGMLCGEGRSRLPAEAVCSKVLSHRFSVLL